MGYIADWAYMGLLSGPHMSPSWACLYGLVVLDPYGSFIAHMGKPVYIAHWHHMELLYGAHMGPLWAFPYDIGIWAPLGSFMGVSVWDPYGSFMSFLIWASPYISHTGTIWACHLDPTWVLNGYFLNTSYHKC